MAVSLGVSVGASVGVSVGVGVDVAVALGNGVDVRVGVAVSDRVGVSVLVAVEVGVRLGDGVDVGTGVEVRVAVLVAVRVGTADFVRVAVAVGVFVRVGVAVRVAAGVGVMQRLSPGLHLSGRASICPASDPPAGGTAASSVRIVATIQLVVFFVMTSSLEIRPAQLSLRLRFTGFSRLVAIQRGEYLGDEGHQLGGVLESARPTRGDVLDAPRKRCIRSVRLGELDDESAIGGETASVVVRHAPIDRQSARSKSQ